MHALYRTLPELCCLKRYKGLVITVLKQEDIYIIVAQNL